MTGYRLLDPGGRVADNRQPILGRRQQNDAASMRHQYGSSRMRIVGVKLLDDHDFRTVLLHNLNYTFVYRMQPRREVGGIVVGRTYDAGFADDRSLGSDFEDAVAGHAQARVDTKDTASRYWWIRERLIHVAYPFRGRS